MHVQRLERLRAELMKNAADPDGVTINLSSWGEKNSCGTVACAIGLATLIPEFQGEGFEPISETSHTSLCPHYVGSRGFEAVCKFFKLSAYQAYTLFMHITYPKTQRTGERAAMAVAERIRLLIKNPEISASELVEGTWLL